MDLRTVTEVLAGSLGKRCCGALGRCHGVAREFRFLVGIGEHEFTPGIAQVMPYPYSSGSHIVQEYKAALKKYGNGAKESYTSLD